MTFRITALMCLFLGNICYGVNPLRAPVELQATWNNVNNGQVKLTWSNEGRAIGNVAFVIQRKQHTTVVTAAWTNVGYKSASQPDVAGGQTFTHYDTVPTTTSGNWQTFFYRVRPVNGTINGSNVLNIEAYGEAAESVIRGQYLTSGTGLRDTDADGINDDSESTYNASATDWADGSADHDGDGIPNAWEANGAINPVAIVDPAFPADVPASGQYRTIKAAVATAALGAGTLLNPTFRLIYVRPGLYVENVVPSASHQIALVRYPLNSSDLRQVELRGFDSTPVVATTSSLVLDGFVLTRTPGTVGPIIDAKQGADGEFMAARQTHVRLVNCLILNADSGVESLIENTRTRVVISHCTFWMNSCVTSSPAHSCGGGGALSTNTTTGSMGNGGGTLSGLLTMPTAHYLQTTARYVIHNCILWNPLNTHVPEIYWDALVPQFISSETNAAPSCIVYGLVSEGMSLDPRLTPDGYVRGPSSIAIPPYAAGSAPTSSDVIGKAFQITPTDSMKVHYDLHGQPRYNSAGRSLVASGLRSQADIGAHQWVDQDEDGLPDFADSSISVPGNAEVDLDFDGLNELQEFLSGTNYQSSDSTFLTLDQARNMFAALNHSFNSEQYYTKTQVDQMLTPKAAQTWVTTHLNSFYYTKSDQEGRYWQKGQAILVPAAGDLGMGSYQAGPPAPSPAP